MARGGGDNEFGKVLKETQVEGEVPLCMRGLTTSGKGMEAGQGVEVCMTYCGGRLAACGEVWQGIVEV